MAIATQNSARNTRAVYTIDELPIAQITPSLFNPRKDFDPVKLQELADSIRDDGLIEALVVRTVGDPRENVYELVAGERRYRACLLSEIATVRATVHEGMDDRTALRIAIVENEKRIDVNPIERAEGYRQLRELGGMTQAEVADSVGLEQSTIANIERLLKLPDDVQELIRAGKLTAAHGRALLRFEPWAAVMSKLAEIAVRDGMASKELEVGVPRLEELVKGKKLAVQIPSYGFDLAECKACPFGAYRATSYQHVCFKPEHYRELASTSDARAAERKTGALERAQAGAIVEASDLASDSYVRCQEVAGCTEACPCRIYVKSMWGGSREAACSDPERWRGLMMAEREKRDAMRQLEISDARAETRRALTADGPLGHGIAVVLGYLALWGDNARGDGEAFRALGCPEELLDRAYDRLPRLLAWLSLQVPEDVIAAAADSFAMAQAERRNGPISRYLRGLCLHCWTLDDVCEARCDCEVCVADEREEEEPDDEAYAFCASCAVAGGCDEDCECAECGADVAHELEAASA